MLIWFQTLSKCYKFQRIFRGIFPEIITNVYKIPDLQNPGLLVLIKPAMLGLEKIFIEKLNSEKIFPKYLR